MDVMFDRIRDTPWNQPIWFWGDLSPQLSLCMFVLVINPSRDGGRHAVEMSEPA